MVFVWGVVRYILSYTTRDECRVVGRGDASSDGWRRRVEKVEKVDMGRGRFRAQTGRVKLHRQPERLTARLD